MNVGVFAQRGVDVQRTETDKSLRVAVHFQSQIACAAAAHVPGVVAALENLELAFVHQCHPDPAVAAGFDGKPFRKGRLFVSGRGQRD
jgi:hypothetical protein